MVAGAGGGDVSAAGIVAASAAGICWEGVGVGADVVGPAVAAAAARAALVSRFSDIEIDSTCFSLSSCS